MNRILLTLSIAALLSPAVAMADPPHGHGKAKHEDRRAHNGRGHGARGKGAGHDNGLHLGHAKKAWRRGERAPDMYLVERYYVDDYRAYDLAPPPRGHRWVRPADDQYLLVEIATGLIAEALGN